MGQKVLKATSSGEGKSRVTDYFDQVFRVATHKKIQNSKTSTHPQCINFSMGSLYGEVFYGSESPEGDLFRGR